MSAHHSTGPSGIASAALANQDEALQEVSRTFALTIPLLPDPLRPVVGNAYLLCRIADTIEDSTALGLEEKRRFAGEFQRVVAGACSAEGFAAALGPRLDGSSSAAERGLVRNAARVMQVTHSFPPEARAALERCVRIMTEGMERFQEGAYADGLPDQAHLDAYCYYVAGVVGEMLTELFCLHSPAAARHRDELMRLAVAFGQGLQMTNIIKDVWEDRQRGVCWLPRTVFASKGVDLGARAPGPAGEGFEAGIGELVGVARRHLEDALRYTLLLPRREAGMREFCLLALGLAVLTLRKINRRRGYRSGAEVKVSRRTVYLTVSGVRLLSRSNLLLRLAFRLLAQGLPRDKKSPAGAGSVH